MSKLLILFIALHTIVDCTIARPTHDLYPDPIFVQRLSSNNENNLTPYEYPEYDPITEKQQQNMWQTLMNSKNPEDEAYVRYYKNYPNKDWNYLGNFYKYGKRNSNSCKFLFSFH